MGQVSLWDTHNYIDFNKLPHIEKTLTVDEAHGGNIFYTVEDLS